VDICLAGLDWGVDGVEERKIGAEGVARWAPVDLDGLKKSVGVVEYSIMSMTGFGHVADVHGLVAWRGG
jgi:hypothetical protein